MRWLLVKDLQILKRSPLLVALLVIYPVIIAVLIGLALSRGPDKPRVAFVNEVPSGANVIQLGGESIDTSKYGQQLFTSIDPVRVDTEAQAIAKVKSGDVLGALVLPPNLTQKLASGIESAHVKVYYNAEDPVKARFVQDTINSQVQKANAAVRKKLTKIALGYLHLIVQGGQFSFFGRHFDVLGLAKAEAILRVTLKQIPQGSAANAQVAAVQRFAKIARDNLDLSDNVLKTVGEPIVVDQHVLRGGKTPLDAFAVAVAVTVSLMFVTLLLAAGTLALEREENAFARLVRGLVSRTGLLAEKGLLAAGAAFLVTLAMLAGLALFIDLAWDRFPLWMAALAAGALGFAAMGVAIGAITREVRAASLMAFMLSLPIAFLALVPSGSVSQGLYDVTSAISAVFPFKPTLDALNAALNDAGGLGRAVVHLALLVLGYGVLARVSLRRFA
ncbi:MAG: type transport system permease protein [Thermoleophilaceae bacterium]|jgi:ABC-2 type transport system permease protein|nr:type transport system permease protein [Thermoleophilaceae bacterium]